ncbi:hypothetical protein [Chitinimonas sp.]|uniref:NHL domain-containing protein n=1 Tax=Chitinimonas sp. TaxID=1934313 RepID=UPI0035AE75F4
MIARLVLFGLLAMCSLFGQAADSALTFTTLAGSTEPLVKGKDGSGSTAEFYSPRGIAIDSSGTMYVADSSNHTIRRLSADGTVTTIAGSAGVASRTDGAASAARFNEHCISPTPPTAPSSRSHPAW